MKRIEKFEIKPNMINVIEEQIEVWLDVGEEDGKCWVWCIIND